MRALHRLCSAAALLVASIFAHAADVNWTGATDSAWRRANNWSNGVPLLGDTAIFASLSAAASITPTIETGDVVDLRSILFGSGAPAYQLRIEKGLPSFYDSLILSGGISNSSGILQTITIDAGFAPPPPDPATAWQGGRLRFTENATVDAGAGVTIVLNSPQGVGVGEITPASFILENYSTAGNARINVLADHNGAAGGNAYIRFRDLSSAGSAQISTEGGYNDGAHVLFENASNAGNSWISNGAGSPNSGYTLFLHGSRANSAQISNQGAFGSGAGGRTLFRDDSKALTANITNYGGNNGVGGITIFDDASSANDATITALGGISGGAGGITEFRGNSTASNATLIANGSLNGGQGGVIRFLGNATGGSATVTANAGATLDISGLSTAGITLTSIAGAGNFILGGKKLTLSGNSTTVNTTVSGIISGANGTLAVTGNGTINLSGQNTFSGGAFLSGGTLNVNSSSALGAGRFTISGGRLSSTNNTAVIPNPTTLQGQFRISPLNPSAELEFAGPVTLSGAVTLRADSAGQIRFSNSISGTTTGLSFRPELNPAGSIIFSGDQSNTYSGITNVLNNGNNRTTLVLAKSGGATAIPSDLHIFSANIVRLAQPQQISGSATVQIDSGGRLDLDGFDQKVSRIFAPFGSSIDLHSPTGAGTLTIDSGSIGNNVISDGGLGGGLIKSSSGSLDLSGANYSGTTLVAAGTLILSGTPGTGPVIVEPGASLAGGSSGIRGRVFIKDQAILSPGFGNSAALFTFDSDLTLSSDSQVLMQLRTPHIFTSPNNDRITVRGTLTLDGTIQFDTTNGFGGIGRYLLFSYSGTLIDNGLNITPPPGFTLNQVSLDFSNPGQIILHVPEPTALSLLPLFSPLIGRRRSTKTRFRTTPFPENSLPIPL